MWTTQLSKKAITFNFLNEILQSLPCLLKQSPSIHSVKISDIFMSIKQSLHHRISPLLVFRLFFSFLISEKRWSLYMVYFQLITSHFHLIFANYLNYTFSLLTLNTQYILVCLQLSKSEILLFLLCQLLSPHIYLCLT